MTASTLFAWVSLPLYQIQHAVLGVCLLGLRASFFQPPSLLLTAVNCPCLRRCKYSWLGCGIGCKESRGGGVEESRLSTHVPSGLHPRKEDHADTHVFLMFRYMDPPRASEIGGKRKRIPTPNLAHQGRYSQGGVRSGGRLAILTQL